MKAETEISGVEDGMVEGLSRVGKLDIVVSIDGGGCEVGNEKEEGIGACCETVGEGGEEVGLLSDEILDASGE